MRTTRIALLLTAFLLVVAACGGDSETTTTTAADVADSSDTTAAPESTTTAAPETTTTTAAPATTTTETPETTTTAGAPPSDDEAQAVADAKTAAAQAVLPEGWTSEIEAGFEVDTGSDDVFSVCTDSDSFDVAELESFTVAVSTLMADAPPSTGFFPAGNASIEARIFESDTVAAEAFAVLETVFGTEEGRQCLTEEFLAEMTADLPAEEGDFEFTLEEIDVAGAEVGVAINISMAVEGISFAFTIELAAGRDGVCTVYGTFLSFGDPFDPDLRDQLFAAAAGAA